MQNINSLGGIEIRGHLDSSFEEILSPQAMAFVAALSREFDPRRRELLERRQRVQRQIDEGRLPDFLAETEAIRRQYQRGQKAEGSMRRQI